MCNMHSFRIFSFNSSVTIKNMCVVVVAAIIVVRGDSRRRRRRRFVAYVRFNGSVEAYHKHI